MSCCAGVRRAPFQLAFDFPFRALDALVHGSQGFLLGINLCLIDFPFHLADRGPLGFNLGRIDKRPEDSLEDVQNQKTHCASCRDGRCGSLGSIRIADSLSTSSQVMVNFTLVAVPSAITSPFFKYCLSTF
jgi:hypothetical protein